MPARERDLQRRPRLVVVRGTAPACAAPIASSRCISKREKRVSKGGWRGLAMTSRRRPSALTYPPSVMPTVIPARCPPSCRRSSPSRSSGSWRTIAATAGDGIVSNSRDEASALAMPSGCRRASAVSSAAPCSNRSWCSGQPCPVPVRPRSSRVHPFDLGRGAQLQRPSDPRLPNSRRRRGLPAQ